jgi:hypothetical protein
MEFYFWLDSIVLNKMVMDMVEGEPDEEKAKLIYDGFSEAMLIRNKGQIIHLPIPKEVYEHMEVNDARTKPNECGDDEEAKKKLAELKKENNV